MKRKPINWQEVRVRLKENQVSLEKGSGEDPERLEKAYRLRASQLAARNSQILPDSQSFPVLVCLAQDERYGVRLSEVVEIIPFGACKPVPGAPPEMLGVIDVRGEIRSVLYLARLLGLPIPQERQNTGLILMIRKVNHQIGLYVDAVEQILRLSPDRIIPPDETNLSLPSQFVEGLTTDTLIILNIKTLLSHPLFSGEPSL